MMNGAPYPVFNPDFFTAAAAYAGFFLALAALLVVALRK
jgi:hypothetical protein